jgi:hypothetical protein
MTDVLVRPVTEGAPAARSRRGRFALAAAPWLLPAAALVGALLATGTPARDVAAYGIYLVAGVAVPGTRRAWPRDGCSGTPRPARSTSRSGRFRSASC